MVQFKAADGGSLFLDEIADMALAQQVKLLRVLQERKVTPLGSTKVVEVDVQVISASSKPLSAYVTSGAFRADLQYRLNTIELFLPALRERPEDIPLLAEYFLRQRRVEHVEDYSFSPSALELMQEYSWPGNVRQLENLIHGVTRLKPKGDVIITPEEVGERIKRTDTAGEEDIGKSIWEPGMRLVDVEREAIRFALRRYLGNKEKTAVALDVSTQTLRRKIIAFNLKSEVHKPKE